MLIRKSGSLAFRTIQNETLNNLGSIGQTRASTLLPLFLYGHKVSNVKSGFLITPTGLHDLYSAIKMIKNSRGKFACIYFCTKIDMLLVPISEKIIDPKEENMLFPGMYFEHINDWTITFAMAGLPIITSVDEQTVP